MKPYVVLHVGMPKTGSTALQRTLHASLEDPSFEYLRLDGAKDCNHLFSLFSTHPEKYHLHQRLGTDAAQIRIFNRSIEQQLTAQLAEHHDRNFIISAESLVTLHESELQQLREFLSRYFEKILVVAYVRPPRSTMESTFQQAVKGPTLPHDIAQSYPRYRLKFEKFDRVFGRDNVKLWKFDSACLLNGDVVADFCHRLGIAISTDRPDARDNESLSRPALQLLYTYRKFYPFGKGKTALAANNRLVSALRTIPGKKLRFSPNMISSVLEQHSEDIAWIEARMGETLAENMVPDKTDINSEADLMVIDDATIDKFRELFGGKAPPGIAYNLTPKQIATLVYALIRKLTPGLKLDMEPADGDVLRSIVRRAARASTSTRQFGIIPEARATALVKAVFAEITQQIDEAENELVIVPGLGRFRVRVLEQERDGKKVSVKRIAFVPAKKGE